MNGIYSNLDTTLNVQMQAWVTDLFPMVDFHNLTNQTISTSCSQSSERLKKEMGQRFINVREVKSRYCKKVNCLKSAKGRDLIGY